MSEPLVSVVVPVYDVEAYLPECLDSLISQTLADIEIICVNDGSPDKCGEILKRYAAKDKRITVIDQPNGGLSVARNTAMERARGKYLAFVDSDDALKPDALEMLSSRAEAEGLDHIIFAAQVFYDGGYTVENDIWTPYYTHKHQYGTVKSGQEAFADLVLNNDYVYAVQLRFSLRSRIVAERLKFRPGMIHEDNLFSFINDLTAQKALVMDEMPYLFRKRADSITTGAVKPKHTAGYLTAFMECLRFAAGKQFPPRVCQAIEKDLNRKYRAACRDFAKMDAADCGEALEKDYPGLPWSIAREPLAPEWRPRRTQERCAKPIVSVIVPVYNTEKYLVECLESIRAQTLKEIEVICVDDGSSDSSSAILEMMAHLDARIKVLHTPRGGGGVARNFAMRFAFGKYLAFFDADDFAAPTLLASLVAKAEAENADIVLSPSMRYSEKEKKVVRTTAFAASVMEAAKAGPFKAQDEAVARRALIDFGNQPWAKLFRRAFVERASLTFQELPRANDLRFVNLAIVLAERISVLGEALYSYRVDIEGTCQTTNDETPTLFLDAWKSFASEARSRKAMTPELELSLANAVWGGVLFTMDKLTEDAAKMRLIRALRKWALKDFGIDALGPGTCFSAEKLARLEKFRQSDWHSM